MTTYTQRNNWNWLAWLLVLISAIMFVIALTSCTKPPDTTPVDCDCGHIIRNTNNGTEWTVVIQNDCGGELDSTVWHFNMDDCKVGDVVCRLHEIDINDLNCKP